VRKYVGIWKGYESDSLTGYHMPLKATGLAAIAGNSLTDPTADFVTAGDGNVAADTKLTKLFSYADATAVSGGVAEMALVISGGADNIPSAGAIRVVVVWDELTALDNA